MDELEVAVAAATAMLDAALSGLWRRGWTPADVVHVVQRECTSSHATVAAGRITAQGRRDRECERLHPRWEQQLTGLADRDDATPPTRSREHLSRLIDLLILIGRLPAVTRTVPPPGSTWRADVGRAGHLDGRMLARVRALLAKAESTSFEEEAEAFTAKAQELIARHAIDEALLHTADDVGQPCARRMLIDDPYADAKSSLYAAVGRANRCQVVSTAGFAWVTVFGYDHDLDAVELLATSLLAQATAAMVRHGSQRDAHGRSRTRSFRRAFLLGFAQRIGERLRRASDEEVASKAATARALLPVLAARDERIELAVRDAFPQLQRRRSSASNATGWWAGRSAAEQARLDVTAPRLQG